MYPPKVLLGVQGLPSFRAGYVWLGVTAKGLGDTGGTVATGQPWVHPLGADVSYVGTVWEGGAR